jgi:hypothetical protein
MSGYTFKTYIANGREYFEFGEEEIGETTLTNEHIHRRSRWLSLCGHSPLFLAYASNA